MATTPGVPFDAKRGFYTTALRLADCVYNVAFSAAGLSTVTPPSGTEFVEITSENTLYVKASAPAAVASNVIDGSGSQIVTQYKPRQFAISTAFGIASNVGQRVSLAFYKAGGT